MLLAGAVLLTGESSRAMLASARVSCLVCRVSRLYHGALMVQA